MMQWPIIQVQIDHHVLMVAAFLKSHRILGYLWVSPNRRPKTEYRRRPTTKPTNLSQNTEEHIVSVQQK